ncbi:MAG: hypothetical protein ACI9OJ_005269 [Myxococcota bacterium]|jgi:hypothetical protein
MCRPASHPEDMAWAQSTRVIIGPICPMRSTISITSGEKIYHPGHYRVAIAQDPSLLPEPPPVTVGTTDCGATIIDANPVLPVLGDGLLLGVVASLRT